MNLSKYDLPVSLYDAVDLRFNEFKGLSEVVGLVNAKNDKFLLN